MDRLRPPSKQEMHAVFTLCRYSHWTSVLQCLQSNPAIGTTSMIMDNHIATTVCHQAITSKGDVQQRANVILQILAETPEAAKIKNGYGSLPLHVIAQRNTKIDAKTKERLITMLINAYPAALSEEGGTGQRTPLHIIFTDYISPKLTQFMIDNGKKATFMRDKNGWLPIHVACSRHVSPDKLRMLVDANPASIFATTNDEDTVLSLAESTATKTHPNYKLIETLKQLLHSGSGTITNALSATPAVPTRVSSGNRTDTSKSNKKKKRNVKSETPCTIHTSKNKKVKLEPTSTPQAVELLLNLSRRPNIKTEPNHLHYLPPQLHAPPMHNPQFDAKPTQYAEV